jgi:hypothetical protein
MGAGAGYLLFFACALLIEAARDLLMPFFMSASYVLGFLTMVRDSFLAFLDKQRAERPKWPTKAAG